MPEPILHRPLRAVAATLLLTLPLMNTPAQAASPFPVKPLLIIVPYPAGGALDVQVRALGEGMAATLRQPVVVEARPGANANIAADFVVRAPADGHTLLATTTFAVSNPLVDPATRWTARDLAPVASFAQTWSYLVVPASSPAKTVRDLIELARQAKPRLQFADGGPGTSMTMAYESLKKTARIELDAVPYKGAPPALTDLANGLLAASFFPAAVATPQITAGRLRALATLGSARTPQLRDVPTIAEAGFPEVTTLTWFGIHAPRNTPADVIASLDAAVQTATRNTEVRTRIANTGGDILYMNTAEFTAFLAGETRRWEEITRTKKP